MKDYSITVKCKPYVQKYFTGIYGDTIILDHQTHWSETILTKMISQPLYRVNKKVLNLSFGQYTAELRFKLPIDLFYRVENQMSEQQLYNINCFLEQTFDNDLFTVICIAGCFGVEKATTIRAFTDKYNIDLGEDITMLGLKKSFYRHSKKQTTRSFFLAQMSSAFANLNLRA